MLLFLLEISPAQIYVTWSFTIVSFGVSLRSLTSNECEKSSSAQPATTLKDLSGLKAVRDDKLWAAVRDDKLWAVVRDDTIFCVTPSETFFQFFPRNLVSLVGSFVCRQTSTPFLNHAVLTIISIIRAPALPSQT